MIDFLITTANLSDVNEVALLFDAYRVFYKKSSDIKASEDFIRQRIMHHESVIFIARQGQIPVGFAQLYPLFSSTRMKRLWLLNDLYVSPVYRCQGVCSTLIDRCKQWAKDSYSCGLLLETAKDNYAANQLYHKMQFELDIDHNYYYFET